MRQELLLAAADAGRGSGGMIRAALIWSLGWLSLLTCWAVTGRYRTWCAHAHERDWRRFVRLVDRAAHWLDGPDHCARQRDKWG